MKEELDTKPPITTQPKIIYQPGQAGDKKPMIILQQKKPLQLPAVRAQSVFKLMQPGTVTMSSATPLKMIQKPTFVTAPSGTNMIRPSFTGNVIKLMPGAILSGNKIIMKPATSGNVMKPATSQQIFVQRPGGLVTSQAGFKLNTVQAPRIVMAPNSGPRPITIGGRTVTLQLAPGQKKVTLVGAPNAGSSPKIIMMPATSNTTQATIVQQQKQPQVEQLDGAIDQEDDIESQISTVKIEKHADGEDVKVTTSGASGSGEKMEESEAAAILSTIGEVSHLTSHSVNTHIPLHDEK